MYSDYLGTVFEIDCLLKGKSVLQIAGGVKMVRFTFGSDICGGVSKEFIYRNYPV